MRFRWTDVAAAAAIAFVAAAGVARAAESPVGTAHVVVTGTTASRGDATGTLRVMLWYPARPGTEAAPFAVGPPGAPLFAEGAVADGAPIADTPKRFPFVVVSHGTGGTSTDTAWLCAGLAARGYIVASVDHPGNNAIDPPTVAGLTLWWLRADDLSRTIDGVLANRAFGPRIDARRIGAAGFSLGGYTVLALAGARADGARIAPYCAGHAGTPLCTGVATPTIPDVTAKSNALAAADPAYRSALAANGDSHRDPRVRSIFAIAPALGPAIRPESLSTIEVPVAIVAGFGDPILPVEDNAIPDARAIPNAELTLLPKPVGHYTFLMDCAGAGLRVLAPICGDSGSFRSAVHATTLGIAIRFFDRTLATFATTSARPNRTGASHSG